MEGVEMTFLTELKRLNSAIPTEQNALTRFGLIQQRDALLANHAEVIAGLVEAAQEKAHHHVCEDSWYSCPKSSEGCANDFDRGTECNCGADKLIAALAKLEQVKP